MDAHDVLIKVNRLIGGGPVLTDEEKKALGILARIRQYLLTREERGDEIFIKEMREAGTSTREFDEEVQK